MPSAAAASKASNGKASDGKVIEPRIRTSESGNRAYIEGKDILNMLVKYNGKFYVLVPDSLQRQPVVQGDSNSNTFLRQCYLVFGTITAVFLSYIWMSAVCRVHNDIHVEIHGVDAAPRLEKLVVGVFITFAIIAFAWLGVTLMNIGKVHDKKLQVKWLPGLLMAFAIGHFTVYMGAIGWEYPHVCEFNHWPTGRGFDYLHMEHVNWTGGDELDFGEWTADCDRVKICPLKGLTRYGDKFCTKGGRELFAMMAHSFPVFLGSGLYVFGGTISFTAELLDLVDMQDFFLLMLEDDVILNYWGRDMCDISGCTGKGTKLWRIIMLALLCSSFVITIRSCKKLGAVSSDQVEDLLGEVRETLLPRKLANRAIGPDAEKNWTAHARFFTLVCVNIPYFAIRTHCSWYYGIIGSTLIMKNLGCIVIDVAIVLYCGDIQAMEKSNPFLTKITRLAGLVGGVEDGAEGVDESGQVLRDLETSPILDQGQSPR